jgi:hypothetical protein
MLRTSTPRPSSFGDGYWKKEKDNKWTQRQIKPPLADVISICAIFFSQQITFILQKSFSGNFILLHAYCCRQYIAKARNGPRCQF